MDTLVIAKFHKPLLQNETVIRQRLSEKLSKDTKVSLISAPAGFGKTTFASGWLSGQKATTAWLSLDENDNDIERFLTYLFTAINRSQPGLGQKSLEVLQSSIQGKKTIAMTQLINGLEEAGDFFILALDDYHLIDNDEIHGAVDFLIKYQPRHLHLLIISRTEPPLSIATLRAKKQLGKVGTDELRFTTEETDSFLNRSMQLSLTGEQIYQLKIQSEGWITGLQLAALSLRDISHARNVFIDNLSGEDRHITDYLLSEVLVHQKQEIKDFLIQTSILKRMNGDICDNLLGRSGSQQILEQLEQDNLFITPLDNKRCWYHYHQLFAQVLSNHLRNRSPEEITQLHRKAARWFMAHRIWEEAIYHALEAKDYDQVIDHLETNIDQILVQGDFSIYLRWLSMVPEEFLPPALSLHRLFFYHEMGQFDHFNRSLQRVEKQLALPDGDEELSSLHGILFAIKGIRSASFFAIDEALEHFGKALSILNENQSFWLIMTLGGYGFCNRVRGNHSEATQIFKQAVRMAREAGFPFCYFMDSIALAKLYMEYGQLHAAKKACRPLIDYDSDNEKEVPFSGLAHVVMGQLHYHCSELSQAQKHLEHGLKKIDQDGDVFSIVDGYLTLAQCLMGQGKPEKAAGAMEEMNTIIDGLDPSQAVTIIAQSCKALIQILNGQFDQAHKSFLESDRQYLAGKRFPDLVPLNFQGIYRTGQQSLTYYSNIIHLIAARLDIEMDRAKDALVPLSELMSKFDKTTSCLFKAEVLIQVALAHRRLGNKQQAQQSLKEAIALVAPENYSQIFIREGRRVYELLLQVNGTQNSNPPATEHFIASILSKISDSETYKNRQHSPFDLTPRELEVLNCLAKGASYAGTAAQLFVSVNTLKTHTKRIYDKLDVANRTQAINKAKEQGLILL